MSDKPVFVTQPFLPPLEEFVPYLEQIWQNKVLTNGGPLHQQLEKALADYLGVPYVALFNNGTNALLTALQVLDLSGEVITTPYSFVATANALLWNRLTPVFVDIDPHTLNLDPARIEAAITPATTAIMPVHCYGNPCDVAAIEAIARKHGLRVIYDAAHAFGVQDAGGSVLRHGDLSVLSFHATKVFNTFEGGAIVCKDEATKKRIDQLKNFGFEDEVTVNVAGINGKMSEVNAAFGLLQLSHIDHALQARQKVDARYREKLSGVRGLRLLGQSGQTVANYSYFPVLVEADYPLSRDALCQKLKDNQVFARRYFYPLISDYPAYQSFAAKAQLPVAQEASQRVLCLPIYPELSNVDFARITALLGGGV
jgi:dTDP-4-amino-4,6-dideoxygalactose transaminase